MNAGTKIAAALLGVLATSTPMGAQQKKPREPETARFGNPTSVARAYQDYVYGVIKQMSPTELVLDKTKFGIEQAFVVDSKTRFIHDGKPGTRERLKVGDQVYVEMKEDKKTGTMIAKKVVTGVAPTGAK